jgi:hypothetical protein
MELTQSLRFIIPLHFIKPSLFFDDLRNQPFCSFLNRFTREDLLSIFRTPYQLVTCIVDRMTRSLDNHARPISYLDARTYEDKGDAPLPLNNPLGKACIHPSRQAAGDSAKDVYKKSFSIDSCPIFACKSFTLAT